MVSGVGPWSRIPGEITTDHILSFDPESALTLRVVSREFSQISEEFLRANMQEFYARCSGADSPLRRLVHDNFLNFTVRFGPQSHRSAIAFHLSVPRAIRALGVPMEECPAKIMGPQELAHFETRIAHSHDLNLERVWGRVHAKLLDLGLGILRCPGNGAPARDIRLWMQAHPAWLAGIRHLDLSHLNLTCVPTEIGLMTGLHRLVLGNNQLVSLSPGLFNGLTSLMMLHLDNNRLAYLPAGSFDGLDALLWLHINNNQLQSLSPGVFNGLADLRRLNIYHNPLHSLSSGVFAGLGALSELLLNDNQLHSLASGVFNGLPGLEYLHLENNHLTSLAPDLFHGLTGMCTLNLEHNRLSAIPPELFNGLPNLQQSTFHGNPGLMVFFSEIPEPVCLGFSAGDVTRIFNYRCRSPFAEFYQRVAGDCPHEVVRSLFDTLDQPIKNAIFRLVWERAECPQTDDPQWGEHHVFDDMQRFNWILKDFVRDRFAGLTAEQKNAVYGRVYALARSDLEEAQAENKRELSYMLIDSQWGEEHAEDNIFRLIDALFTV